MTATARLEALPDPQQKARTRRSERANKGARSKDFTDPLAPGLPRHLVDMLHEPVSEDRSGQTHALVAAAVEWGLSDEQILALAAAHPASTDKYGEQDDDDGRLDDEVERVIDKLRPNHQHVGKPCDTAGCPNRPDWMTGDSEEQKQDDAGTAGWEPTDLGPYLDGTYTPPVPALLRRSDGGTLVYPGAVHWLSGEPEAGKTWLALLTCAQVLLDGGTVVYIDLEDGAAGTVPRLLDLGVPAEVIRERFRYISPEGPLNYTRRRQLEPLVDSAALLVVDAATEAMAQQSLDDHKGTDVAKWLELLPRWAARRGPAVLVLDHVVKDSESRGRWATGSGHKLAGLGGVAFTLEAIHPAGRGVAGRSRLIVNKDRHGQVSGPRTVETAGRKRWAGDLVIDARGGALDVVLHPPSDEPQTFRPTVLMGRVCDALTRASEPLTVRGVLDRVKGKRDADVRAALAALVDEGFVVIDKGARGAQLHRLVKPFEDEEK